MPLFDRSRIVLTAQVAIVSVAFVWFVVNVCHQVGPALIGWLFNLASAVLAGGALCATGRGAHVNRAAGRFWRYMGAGTLLVGLGSAVRGFEALDDPRGPIGAVDGGVFLCALIIEGWALLRLPLRLSAGARRLTFVLDACTVLVAAALFLWQFWLRPSLANTDGNQAAFVTGLATMVVALLAVFAVVKVALTGGSTVDRAALRWFGLAITVGILASAPESLLPAGTPSTSQIGVPASCLCAVLAARRQRDAGPSPDPAVPLARRRPFSVLPYVAVAASNVLLIFVVTVEDTGERLGVAVGVVILAALVVARQILAFQENSRLVASLDERMMQLRDRERRFRSLVQNASDLITVTDPLGTITYASPGTMRLIGSPPEAWTGRFAGEMLHAEDLAHVVEAYYRIANEPDATAVLQARLAHADGSWRWVEVTMANLMHDPGIAGIVCNARDVTDARDFQQRLHHQASHDALTDLANRTLFGEQVTKALRLGPPNHVRILLIDLNEFKTVNDTLGHAAGDALIAEAAGRLTAAVRDTDLVARLGGDEFAILLEHADDAVAASVVARIAAAFEEPVRIDGRRLRLAASIGIATGAPRISPEELLRRADVAMYGAKADRAGPPTRHLAYTPALDVPVKARAALEQDLRSAVDQGQFTLLYQPIVALDTTSPAKVEALVRWEHPDRGTVSPTDFVPLAETTGLIVPLGRWILAEACRQAVQWQEVYGQTAPRMSVNVSARQLQEPDFPDDVRHVLDSTGLSPDRLTIEITETATLHYGSVRAVHALRNLGVRISLDDFGTGHSSLSTLQSCPIDEVKLDRAFTDTCTAPDGRTVAAAVIEMARALHIEAIAEGVENLEQSRRLTQLGYRYGQGYYFAAPLPPENIAALLSPLSRADLAPTAHTVASHR